APQDYPGYCNPDADRLLDDARAVADLSARKAIYEKLTRIILDDVPKLYLYHRRVLIAHTARLEGYKQMPDGLVRVVGLKLK
ncbi:MAG: ABC transporter substrate-binding protein, partial [Xanthobacteraceae bacterium]